MAVVDMVGYSHVARLLEENISSSSVSELNAQIQAFMSSALGAAGDTCQVVSRTGDGIIVLFQQPTAAHRFGYQVHCVAAEHNTHRTERTAQRRFRVGVATGEVTVTHGPGERPEYAGTTIANAVRLEAAAGPGQILVDQASFAALPREAQALYEAEETVKGKRDERYKARRCRVDCTVSRTTRVREQMMTRRALLSGGAVLAAGVAATAWVKAPTLADLIHPLPQKRFVALLAWPPHADAAVAPALQNTVDLVGNELSRAEAYDHDLLVMPHSVSPAMTTMAAVNELRESMGANLILAASAAVDRALLRVRFRVYNGSDQKSLREAEVHLPVSEQEQLPGRAIRTVVSLLDVRGYNPDTMQSAPGTRSPEAYELVQRAQSLMKEDNDTGLQAAVDAYRGAIDRDSKYADAYAGLALAYGRLAAATRDPVVLALAKSNADVALSLDARSVGGHKALAAVYQQSGDEPRALGEIKRALAVDPANYNTLTWQAQLYTRLNRWSDAEEAYARIIRQRPNYWLAHNEFGILLNAEARYPEALQEFQVANRAAPRSVLALNNIAAVLLTLGRVTDALKTGEKCMSIFPNALAAGTLAAAWRGTGDYTQARGYAVQGTQLGPSDSTTWLELGDCESLLGQKTEAAKAYGEAERVQVEQMDADPTNGPGAMLLALYKAKCNQPVEASAWLQKADALLSGDMDTQLYRVRTLAVLGRNKEARAAMLACRKRGATTFQLKLMPDLRTLTDDESSVA